MERFKALLAGDQSFDVGKTEDESQQDVLVAVCVVLLLTAGIDNVLAPEELVTIVQSFRDYFDFEDSEARDLIDLAHALCLNADKAEDFLGILRNELSLDDRQLILTLVWKVIVADGRIVEAEEDFSERLTASLGLTAEHNSAARSSALDEYNAN